MASTFPVRECTEREIRLLSDEGVIRQALLVAVEGSWRVILQTDAVRIILISEKAKRPRQFAKLDTAALWLFSMGIKRFYVEMAQFAGPV